MDAFSAWVDRSNIFTVGLVMFIFSFGMVSLALYLSGEISIITEDRSFLSLYTGIFAFASLVSAYALKKEIEEHGEIRSMRQELTEK
mgnify:CR=1 FL=1